MNSRRLKTGFGITEIIVTVGIIAMLAVFGMASFRNAKHNSALKNGEATVLHALERARSRAQSGFGDTKHGVLINTNEVISFEGDSYTGTGITYPLPTVVSTDQTGTEIVFSRISGTPSAGAVVTLTNILGETGEIEVNTNGSINFNE